MKEAVNRNAIHLSWVHTDSSIMPAGAVEAGSEAEGPLYICRASYAGGVHPGKVRLSFSGYSIEWGGREVFVPEYEVLVAEAPTPCNELLTAVSVIADEIPAGCGLFLEDSEKQHLRAACHEIRSLAFGCGCIDLVDIAETTSDLTLESLLSRNRAVSQLRQIGEIARGCVDVSPPQAPSQACADAAIATYDLADTLRADNDLFLGNQEKQRTRDAARTIRDLASRCGCIAFVDGAQRVIDAATATLPERSAILRDLQETEAYGAGVCQARLVDTRRRNDWQGRSLSWDDLRDLTSQSQEMADAPSRQ